MPAPTNAAVRASGRAVQSPSAGGERDEHQALRAVAGMGGGDDEILGGVWTTSVYASAVAR